MNRRKALAWLLVAVLWTGVIFLFSSRGWADSNRTSTSLASLVSNLLIPDFSSWGPSVQAEWLSGINSLLRKVAHVFEFALLGALSYLAALHFSDRLRRRRPSTKLGVGITAFYPCAVIAALDELLQRYSAGRTPSPRDMLLDCAGAVVGIVVCACLTRLPKVASKRDPALRRRG